jgi:hypothetical protein
VTDPRDDTQSAADDWLSWSDLQCLFDADTLRRLRPHLTHTGLDGRPCVEAVPLDDLLRLLGRDGGAE